jgi:hypothetical protein
MKIFKWYFLTLFSQFYDLHLLVDPITDSLLYRLPSDLPPISAGSNLGSPNANPANPAYPLLHNNWK